MASWELHIEHLLIHLDYLTTKRVDHVENEWLAWVGGSSCVLLPEKKVKLWWGRRSCLSVESRSKTRSRPLGTEVNSASTWGRPQNSLSPHQFTAKNNLCCHQPGQTWRAIPASAKRLPYHFPTLGKLLDPRCSGIPQNWMDIGANEWTQVDTLNLNSSGPFGFNHSFKRKERLI